MKFWVVLFLTLLNISQLAHIVKSLYPEQIINGIEATENELGYQVSLQVDDFPKCGAGIIGRDLIITAAHCLMNETTGKFLNQHFVIAVTINASDWRKTRLKIDVDKAYIPSSYKIIIEPRFKSEGDIAVLRLQTSLQLTKHTFLKSLKVSAPYHSHLRKRLVIAGYGYNTINVEIDEEFGLEQEFGESDGKLRYAEAEVVPNYKCNKMYTNIITSSLLCAKIVQIPEYDRGVCSGDSGSPLVLNSSIVIGILIGGPVGCLEDIQPGIYTRVSRYHKFIVNAMKDKRTSEMRTAKLINRGQNEFVFVEN